METFSAGDGGDIRHGGSGVGGRHRTHVSPNAPAHARRRRRRDDPDRDLRATGVRIERREHAGRRGGCASLVFVPPGLNDRGDDSHHTAHSSENIRLDKNTFTLYTGKIMRIRTVPVQYHVYVNT